MVRVSYHEVDIRKGHCHMKRIIAAVIAFLLLLSSAYAEMPDFSGMTEQQILDVINAGRNAIVLSETTDELVRIETEQGLTIVIKDLRYPSKGSYIYLDAMIVNDSDTDYTIRAKEVYINGWKCGAAINSDVLAHRRANEDCGLRITDTPITSQEEIEEIELYLYFYPTDGNRSRDSITIDPIVLSFK